MECPYSETLFVPPNLRLYQIELNTWREILKMTPKPKLILPKEKYFICQSRKEETDTIIEKKQTMKKHNGKVKSIPRKKKKYVKRLKDNNLKKRESNRQIKLKNFLQSNKKHSDFNLSGVEENNFPVEEIISSRRNNHKNNFFKYR